jgi:hypothetical protein
VYDVLCSGQSIYKALLDGRKALGVAQAEHICDWGIPVLYSLDPDVVIFPSSPNQLQAKSVDSFDIATVSEVGLSAIAMPETPGSPSLTVERTILPDNESVTRRKVALVDFDSMVGFLPEIVKQANEAQSYYAFQVSFLPLPCGAVGTDSDAEEQLIGPQMFVPRVEHLLTHATETLGVKDVVSLTRCMVAGVEDGVPFYNHFAATLDSNEHVSVVSTFHLRRYAREAGVPFAKAVFMLSLSMILAMDEALNLDFHAETAGCFFDYCEDRDDIVVGLRKRTWDHASCRAHVTDPKQLAAIDALVALQISSEGSGTGELSAAGALTPKTP